MNVAILGVNGFLGQAISQQAHSLGHRVVGVSRSGSSGSEGTRTLKHFEYVSGHRQDPRLLKTLITHHRIDVVVDVIPMTLADTQPVLDCLNGKVSQYLMLSSSDVYANYELLHQRTTGQPQLHKADEDSPLRTTRFPYREQTPRPATAADRYLDDYDKIPIEQTVQQLSNPWSILRLPMIYGPGDKQRRFRWAIKPMLEGAETLVLPTSWAAWETTYGYIDNVAAAIAQTLGHRRAYNQRFNIAEPETANQLEWARKFANTLGWQGKIELTDDPDIPLARHTSQLNLQVPFKIGGQKFRETFGFANPITETVALEQTIASESI